jgi:hypothetical protein
MNINVIYLLKLFTKVSQLDLNNEVKENTDGNYLLHIRDFDIFDEEIIITQEGNWDWDNSRDYDTLMCDLDDRLEEKRQKKIKEEKRKELIAKLTPEEKELLGLYLPEKKWNYTKR